MSHPLDSCRAKLARAGATCTILLQSIEAYVQGEPKPYVISTRHQSDGLEFAFVAHGDPAPPIEFSVISGEIVHHLRSSLDHLIHALVTHRGGKPTRQHQFPICDTPKAFKDLCHRGYIHGIGPTASRIVEAVQPFQSPTPDDTILSVVSKFDNIDKHRLLVVTTTAMQIGNNIRVGVDESVPTAPAGKDKPMQIVGLGDPSPKRLSHEGVVVFTIKLGAPTPEFSAKAEFVADISFEKCGRSDLVSISRTLPAMIAGVRSTIEKFSEEFT